MIKKGAAQAVISFFDPVAGIDRFSKQFFEKDTATGIEKRKPGHRLPLRKIRSSCQSETVSNRTSKKPGEDTKNRHPVTPVSL